MRANDDSWPTMLWQNGRCHYIIQLFKVTFLKRETISTQCEYLQSETQKKKQTKISKKMAKFSMDCLSVTLNSPSFDTHIVQDVAKEKGN